MIDTDKEIKNNIMELKKQKIDIQKRILNLESMLIGGL